jgi:hypothetical protein
MTAVPFDPADPGAWLSLGRRPEHAFLLADVWTRLPDLPSTADGEARRARMRERALALRPIMDALSKAAEDARQASNFAFTEKRVHSGDGDVRDEAILRARSLYGHDWDRAVRYAAGWYAATAGREPETRRHGPATAAVLAYDQGFADGGGNRDDIFDTARRAYAAAGSLNAPVKAPTARPLPSAWPKPADQPLPARWARRLLLLGAPEAGRCREATGRSNGSALLLPDLQASDGLGELTVILVSGAGCHALCTDDPVTISPVPPADAAFNPHWERQLRALLAGRDFDDILVAAQGPWLALLDRHAAVLPLCRTMERTRNSPIQQRAQFRIWLARGLEAGQTIGAGHIRWGKAMRGLTGKLGEFTARYTGKLSGGGHRILIEIPGGQPAMGYTSAAGEPLSPEIVIGNRAHLRAAMSAHLRAFGAATRLTGPRAAETPGTVHNGSDRQQIL